MTYATMSDAGPLWAVFGAPLVGVPLMVAVLALGSGAGVDTAVDADSGFVVEQVGAPEAPAWAEAITLPNG
jgi:hypothetical protein